jgi:hypothetical protein
VRCEKADVLVEMTHLTQLHIVWLPTNFAAACRVRRPLIV